MQNLSLLTLVTAIAAASLAQAQSSEEAKLPSVKAVKTAEVPLLDGILDEEAWAEAIPVTEFLQREPHEGAPASEITTVRILFDTGNIYFGVLCRDSDPDGIRATELRRDDSLINDDIFELILDTFHDHRNGYLFRINPLGTKYDATVANDGLTINENWDERWEAATRITSEGWSAEIAIPFKSLRFQTGEPIVWGVNFHRSIKRKNEEVLWADHSRDFIFEEVSRAGQLEGLSEIQGFRLRVKSYGTTGGSQVVEGGLKETENLTDIGIEDMKFLVTSQLALDLTVNPDFAQADVDDAQVNLTRFSQFFPERREFFQERSGIFQFGTGEIIGQEPQVLLFHSRRIGLSEDREEVPIYGGIRLAGKQGPLDLGLLNMQTKPQDDSPGQNFTALRVKGNILARSYLGAIFTRNTADLSGEANQTGGIDASFTFLRNLNLSGFLAKSDSSHLNGGQWAGQGKLDWESDRIEFELEHVNIQENFDPGIGFVPRDNIKRNYTELDYQPRPDISLIRQLEFGADLEYTTNQEGDLRTRAIAAESSVTFESGDDINFEFMRTFERLEFPFRIRGGGTIPPGDYLFNRFQFRYRSFRGRMLSGDFIVSTGGFFDGTRTGMEISPQFKPTQRLSIEPGYEWNKISLPDGSFFTQEFNGQVNYSLNQRWLTQTAFLLNSQDELFTMNFRLNYIFREGDDLFVVYNDTRGYGSEAQPRSRTLIVKLTFSLDL